MTRIDTISALELKRENVVGISENELSIYSGKEHGLYVGSFSMLYIGCGYPLARVAWEGLTTKVVQEPM